MLNKAQVVAEYNHFLESTKLKPEQAALNCGALAVLLGAREETEDLDIDVDPAFFDTIAESASPGNSTLDGLFGQLIQYSPLVSIHKASGIPTEMYGSVCGYTLEALIDQKVKMMQHPKRKPGKSEADAKDVGSLKKLLD